MPIDRRKATVFAAAAAIRLGIFVLFAELPDLLAEQVEISTPVNSFKRLQEGVYLYNRDVSPYDGGVFHQAPILLSLFSFMPFSKINNLMTALLFTAIDLLVANALSKIAESGEAQVSSSFTSSRQNHRLDGAIVSAAYLFSPFTLAACLGRSTSTFTNLAVIQAVASAIEGEAFQTTLALAFASYLAMYPALLLPPIALLCMDRMGVKRSATGSELVFILNMGAGIIGGMAVLLCLSYLITGSWNFLSATYGVQLMVPDLTPNIGLWWYFFIEIFDSFREFFLGVFWLHLVGYVGGLTIRLRKQPLFVITSLLGLLAIFKPYPSISDVSLYLAFLPLYKHIFPLMRYGFIASSVLLYATLLGPAFYYLWIYAGSGNANFFYAITLVWSLSLTLLVGDSLFAVLRDEWEAERPEMKGKDVRQI